MKKIKIIDKNYPRKLLKIKDAPSELYIEGNINLLNNTSIAIVGSRKCTEYGIKYASLFAKELSKNNITVVSGLALGIDTVAHEYSKDFKGHTIAVLGSGFNKIYPKENQKLFYDILDNGGCIISEYDINCEPASKNFPERNRIISGISDGILVVEATYKSGSVITAKLGKEQNKKIFCIPRNLGEIKGNGTNNLIKYGAKLVTSPNDILMEFSEDISKNFKIKEDTEYEEISNTELIETIELKESNIDEEYINIYNLITYIPINIEVLSKKCNMGIAELNEKLTILELEGIIKSLPGNQYVRR